MGAAAAVFGSTASRALLAAAAGAGVSLALVHTWAWAATLLGLALLVALIRHVSPGRAAWVGLAFGSAWVGAATWWLFISMHHYGGMLAPVAALAVALLALVMGAYVALACAAFARWKSRRHGARDALFFALLWLLAELARARLFTGFPWGASGYTQIDGPLAALAPWIGVYGIGFVVALIAALVVLVHGALWKRVLPLLALVIAPLAAWDFTRPSTSASTPAALRVSLLQTNIPQKEKFDARRLKDNMRELQATVATAKGTLVVVPETAIPLLPQDLGPEGFAGFEAPFPDARRGALVGLPLGDFERGYTNSVAGFGGGPFDAARDRPRPDGAARYHYDKHHLVPFGEFIPFGFRWFVDLMHIPLGDFARGPLVAPSFRIAGQRVAPNICYEDLFGEELALRFGPAGDAPTIFANVSNIAWFGDTIAIDQHLNISRMRTLELQRPMIRATNTGATAVIDHTGRVTAALPRLTKGVLDATVEGREGVTPYAQWIAAGGGVWPLALGAAVLAALLALARRDFRAPVEGV
jgi:apolipoprotein N-acyltransferase